MMPPVAWPNRAASRQVRAGGINWHVQLMGAGPVMLLLHGTGAATHSWRDLAPLLADRFQVVAPDLPGHGFTENLSRARMSMDGMAQAVRSLLLALDVRPDIIAGHSAGAAIAIRMALGGLAAPAGIVGLNAALLPMGGTAGQIFSPLAKLLAGLPLLPHLFALRARDPAVVRRLLDGTGSHIDARGAALYAQLLRQPGHASAALDMMARWDLAAFARTLPGLATPLLLIVGSGDRTVPPDQAAAAQAMVPGCAHRVLEGYGHLMHEEAPDACAAAITEFAASVLPLELSRPVT